MTFEKAYAQLKLGKAIRRPWWKAGVTLQRLSDYNAWVLVDANSDETGEMKGEADFFADDWEVVD